jgi:hypothetical protein
MNNPLAREGIGAVHVLDVRFSIASMIEAASS